jgi:hypothetical protein
MLSLTEGATSSDKERVNSTDLDSFKCRSWSPIPGKSWPEFSTMKTYLISAASIEAAVSAVHAASQLVHQSGIDDGTLFTEVDLKSLPQVSCWPTK